ncbi:ABC transporter permease [Bifidobacterium sp. SO4]|uniref:ABC transporter permease n=1 Tax=Bifidobacterium sp. SO4 TaxID=2809030 RepID=UPI001BDD3799|nr:ABC transporter permease [Bifidobacterium sp. SO4]MBT1170638.1 ABC transporter permease [Bifidobacterium sp. SO4]
MTNDMNRPKIARVERRARATALGELRSRITVVRGAALAWIVILVALVVYSYAARLDAYGNDYTALSQVPSAAHLFGTDNLGRDVFARTMRGATISAVVGLTAVLIGFSCGLVLGMVSGYLRGFADTFVEFVCDVAFAVPPMLIISTIVALRGPSITVIACSIGIFSIPMFTRMCRAATIAIASENYVTAARVQGAGLARIIMREILPGVLPQISAYAFTALARAIVTEGSLSFLGFGMRPPTPSWGGLIAEGRTQLAAAPWVTLCPVAALCLTIFAINTIKELFDPEAQA